MTFFSPFKIRALETLPKNFETYTEEISEGLCGLYGPQAAVEYRRKAQTVFRANIAHPSVVALGAFDRDRVAGLLFGLLREPMAEISHVHILREYSGQGVEVQLVREAAAVLRMNPIERMVVELVPFCALDLKEVLAELGFEYIARQLMRISLEAPGLAPAEAWHSVPLRPEDWAGAAACIVDAYRGHPGHRLHFEVGHVDRALDFLARVHNGNYGPVTPGFVRMVAEGGQCAGVVLACELAPRVGFVLQVAVSPAFQGRGMGTTLLREVAGVFRDRGLESMVLGVTRDNPARRLYERLGFSEIRPVEAYVWTRDPASSVS